MTETISTDNMSSVKQYFGTDGIRGRVGVYPITAPFVLKLGWAIGRVLTHSHLNKQNKVLIGKDTRLSGYMLESALEAGLSAAGVNIGLLGPMPTPAIAYLTRALGAKAGIVISASHNPYHDNGIKLFSSEGLKLPDVLEHTIEQALSEEFSTVESPLLGKAFRLEDAPGRYIEFCKSRAPGLNCCDMKIVVDCAHGATYHVAPDVFRELGATVIELGVSPNGMNINLDSGTLNLTVLKERVLLEKADLGIAFDGDGDRVMMVDHLGERVDGDQLLFIIARHRYRHHGLREGIVGTVMSNFGLEQAITALGLPFVRAQVGDRYVLDMLQKRTWHTGGESSGHIVLRDLTTTGDGIISALQILLAIQTESCDLHTLKQGMTSHPQILLNVPCFGDKTLLSHPDMQSKIQAVQSALSHHGRLVVRFSGTESVLRIMVEGENYPIIEQYAQDIAHTAKNILNQ